MSSALNIYHRLPASSRSIVASARGYYLRWWRYDKETDRLVDQALERDSWSKHQWDSWQSERLGRILHRAATRVPHYRRHWEERRRQGDMSSWDYLENWPILEKKMLRAGCIDFVADDCSTSKMFHDRTSGTTGTAIELRFSAQAVREWYALLEARARKWYGVSHNDRWATLGGQLVTPVRQKKPPFWVWNAGLNQLYLSSYHLSPDLIPTYLDAIVKHRIRYILGYASSIYALAQQTLKLGRKDITLDVAITNAEPLYEYQREAISKAFSCPVRETYGMAEAAAAASECEYGAMHQWPDAGIIEIDREGTSSDLICTGLINADMPLIRYRVGDSGELSEEECSCGKRLPLMEKIEGRSDDLLYTADGRRIGRLSPTLKNRLPFIEAQIIQKSLNQLNVRYVPTNDFSKDALTTVTQQICERMGDIEVTFEEMITIPRTERGKFRAVVCELSDEERMRLEQNGRT